MRAKKAMERSSRIQFSAWPRDGTKREKKFQTKWAKVHQSDPQSELSCQHLGHQGFTLYGPVQDSWIPGLAWPCGSNGETQSPAEVLFDLHVLCL